jgi:ribosomal-protein-alanine acetyltransferase
MISSFPRGTMAQQPAHARADEGADPGAGDLSIRPAIPDDVPALLALENSAFVADRMSRRSLARIVGRPTARLLVASIGGRPAGYVLMLLHARRRAARVYSLAVAAEFAGRGIGRALIEAGCDAARAAGRESVSLEVRADNRRAIELYRRFGFVEVGRAEDYYEDGESALRMACVLATAGGAAP